MSNKILVTLAIIAGMGVGVGALVFGILIMIFGRSVDDSATITAIGSAILGASMAALVAHLSGGFRELDDPDR